MRKIQGETQVGRKVQKCVTKNKLANAFTGKEKLRPLSMIVFKEHFNEKCAIFVGLTFPSKTLTLMRVTYDEFSLFYRLHILTSAHLSACVALSFLRTWKCELCPHTHFSPERRKDISRSRYFRWPFFFLSWASWCTRAYICVVMHSFMRMGKGKFSFLRM